MSIKTALSLFIVFLSSSLSADYLHIDELTPGQLRFSSKNVQEKVEQALKKGDAIYRFSNGKYEGKYDQGRSIFPEKEALPVVKSCFGYILTDGHHHVLAALLLGLPYVPTKVIADYSDLSVDAFWDEVEKKEWVYLYDLEGEKRRPTSNFCELEEDANRYFAAITARKCGPDGDLSKSWGAEYPLWIKVGRDIPFIEFKISDVLHAEGIYYTYDLGDQPDEAFMERAREALLEAKIPGLRVVPEKTHWTELKIS